MANQAAWLTAKQSVPLKVDSAPMPVPEKDDVIIRVRAVAINPVDWAAQYMGFIFTEFPAIGGCDAAGEVTAIGSGVTQFKVGDRVTGACDHEGQSTGRGTFQLYCRLNEKLTGRIPQSIGFADASVLPLGMATACNGLFNQDCLGLELPRVDPKAIGKVILVWGASSSVGSCGVQAAKAAGYEVAATAGAHNQEYCKSIGADHVFDYNSETLVQDVVAALKGKDSAGVFNAVMGEETYIKSAEIAVQLGGVQIMASVLPEQMPYEKPLPGGVKFAYNWGSDIKRSDVGAAVWHRWVPTALDNGSLKCKPDPYVVGQGLEKIQDAIDTWKSGASARKYVVEIP